MRQRLVGIIIALLFCSHLLAFVPIIHPSQAASGRSGIDVYVSNIDIAYQNSADTNKYQMFSSNHPISGFNRPANLFVVDGVSGVPMTVSITASNSGTSDSSSFPTEVVILHDEYIMFELHNTSFTFPNVPASGSSSTSFTWTPSYTGNHTMEIRLQNTNDDVYSNNVKTRHMTIAYHYDNCDDLSTWSAGNGWSSNSDTSTSAGVSCHVGNGQSSTYGASWSTNLDMPVMDLSNAVASPSRVVGLSFFYTGSVQQGDSLSIQARSNDGTWEELASITGTIDGNFLDGTTNWQTFSVASGSQVSPTVPMASNHFHTSSQIRFSFSSDASGQDIGYWIDDIVMFYDQKAEEGEFDWRTGTPADSQARRGEWSDHTVRIFNEGNLSDRFIPSVQGLPSDWEVAFNHETGSNVDTQNGVRVSPGESKDIRIRIKPGANASTGNQSFTFSAHSMEYSNVKDSSTAKINVLPDHIPSIIELQTTPTCAAGNSCEFFVQVENIGDSIDTFDLTVSPFDLRQGWSLGLAWDQNSAVQIAPGNPANIKFIVSVPEGEDPDVSSSVTMEVTSRSDPSRSDSSLIKAAAAMISNAEFSIQEEHVPSNGWVIEPGDSVTVRFTLWNNASRQDTFSFELDVQGSRTWQVDVPEYPILPINPGSNTVYSVTVTAPETAQAGDPGPVLVPKAQSTRSSMNASNFEFSEIVVTSMHDLMIRATDLPSLIRPGNATIFSFEVENEGNGFVDAVITVPDLPSTWHWWTVVDGINYTGPFELTPSYELRDVAIVQLHILAPANEVAGESLEFRIIVEPLEGEDSNLEDNVLSHEVLTSSVKRPVLDPPDEDELNMMTTGRIDFIFSVTNQGNVVDNGIKVRALHSTNPPGGQVSVIVEKIGGSQTLGSEWLTSTLQPGASTEYIVSVSTDSDLPLGTIVTITIAVVGGEDENQQPYLIEHEVKITADIRQQVDINLVSETIDSKMDSGKDHLFELEFESSSSIDEYLTVVFEGSLLPLCNANEISNQHNLTLVKSTGSSPTFYALDCKLSQEKLDLTSTTLDIEVLRGEDSLFKRTVSLSWEKEQTSSSNMFSMGEETMYIGGAGVLILAVVVLLVLSRSRSKEEEEFQQEPQYVENQQAYGGEYSSETQHAVAAENAAYPTQTYQPLPSGPPATQVQTVPNTYSETTPQIQSLTAATSLLSPEPKTTQDRVYDDGFSNSQLLNAGWTQDQIDAKYATIPGQSEPAQPLQNAFDSLGGVEVAEDKDDVAQPVIQESETVQLSENKENPTLPSVNCIISGVVLTENHQWSQCPECGGWADAMAKSQTSNCPRCRFSW